MVTFYCLVYASTPRYALTSDNSKDGASNYRDHVTITYHDIRRSVYFSFHQVNISLQLLETITESQNQVKYKNVELSSNGHIYKTTIAAKLRVYSGRGGPTIVCTRRWYDGRDASAINFWSYTHKMSTWLFKHELNKDSITEMLKLIEGSLCFTNSIQRTLGK